MTTSTALAPTPGAGAPVVHMSANGIVSLDGVDSLDAAILSRLVRVNGNLARQGKRVRIVRAAPAVARALNDIGLEWMLAMIPAANEPMRRAA